MHYLYFMTFYSMAGCNFRRSALTGSAPKKVSNV